MFEHAHKPFSSNGDVSTACQKRHMHNAKQTNFALSHFDDQKGVLDDRANLRPSRNPKGFERF